jgi:hypothetical protein
LKAQEGIGVAADVKYLLVPTGQHPEKLWRPSFEVWCRWGNSAAKEFKEKRSRENGLAMSQIGWVLGKTPVERISEVVAG